VIALIARMRVVEGKQEQFEALMKQLAVKVAAEEPDCLQYQLCRSRDGTSYLMIERYADKAALKKHGETPYFAEAVLALGECLQGAPEIEVLKVVE